MRLGLLLVLPAALARTFPKHVMLVTRAGCAFSAKARKLLDSRGIDYADLNVTDLGFDVLAVLKDRSYTYPAVYVNAEFIGGADELEGKLEDEGVDFI